MCDFHNTCFYFSTQLAVVGHFAPVNEQERFRPTETMWLQCEWWDEEARVNAQKLVKGAEINVVGVLVENKWKDKASGEERKQHRFRISKLLTKEELESLIVILGKDKKVDVANNDVNAIPPVWSTPANPTPPPITTPTVAAVVPKTATVSAPSPPTLPTSTIKPKPRAKVIPNTNNTIASTTTVTTTAAPHNSNNTITKTVPTEDKHKQEQEGSMGIVSENATKNIAVVASKPSPPSSNKRPLAKTPRTYKPPNTIPAINNNNNNSVKNSSSNSNSSFGKKSSLSSAPQPMRPPSPSVIPVVTMKGAAKEVEGDEVELTWDSIEANLR